MKEEREGEEREDGKKWDSVVEDALYYYSKCNAFPLLSRIRVISVARRDNHFRDQDNFHAPRTNNFFFSPLLFLHFSFLLSDSHARAHENNSWRRAREICLSRIIMKT